MAARTSSPVRTSSHRSISAPKRSLGLGALGLVSLVIGGLALRSTTAEETAGSGSGLRNDVMSEIRDALIAGQGAVIEIAKGKRSSGLAGDGPAADSRSTVDSAKVAQLTRRAAQKSARAAELLGTGVDFEGLDVEKTAKELEGLATRATAAKSASKDWSEFRDALESKLRVLEAPLEDEESEADTGDELAADTAEDESDGDSSYERYLLLGMLTFVFLNFGLLVAQTLRSQKTPKIVLDTLTTSSSFLIGAGTSSWMS